MTRADSKKGKYGAMAEKALKEAVKMALKQHQKMGVPAVFMKDGKIVYLLPNGKISEKKPRARKSTRK
ncbi:hypothetical protein ACFL5U_02300 [Candidatus Margulisiibacteriota bacterium]